MNALAPVTALMLNNTGQVGDGAAKMRAQVAAVLMVPDADIVVVAAVSELVANVAAHAWA